MKPILFSKNSTSFTTNGIGRLDAISCEVTEERNGQYELEMEIAETALHADEIEMTSIIVAKPSQSGSNQAFRVYKMTKPINGKFIIYAQHISYQLSYIPVMPFTVTASTAACTNTLAGLKSNAVGTCPFDFHTDVQVVASYSQSTPASLRSRLGGVEGSVLDQFGGEYKWDNYDVYLLNNRGLTSPAVSLRYGKNITDLEQEENIENTITGIVPFWTSSEGETLVTLPEKVIESSTASNFPFKRTVPYDFSSAFQEEPTQAQLRAKAQAYVNQSGIGIPKVSIDLSFISLADTEEYKDVAALQAVNLCDVIGVYFEKLDISTTAKIVKTVYNVLTEKYDSITIGSLRSTLASTISSQDGAIANLANNTKKMFAEYNNTVGELIDNATAWLTAGDGYVVAVKNNDGSWKELLFMDTNDVATAHNVLRVNQNGLGFSSTGVAGPYTQAWTLDGKLVIGGTNVPSLTVYDNLQQILFQIDKNGLQWNAPNSSMTTQGILTMTKGKISTDSSGSRIVLDGTIAGAPTLTLYGSNNDNILMQANSSGLTVNGGTLTGGVVQTGTSGSRIVLDGTQSGAPTLRLYDNLGNILMEANNGGVSVNNGTITGGVIQTGTSGSRIALDGTVSGAPTLTLYGSNNNNVLMQATNQGLTVNGGTLTGGVVQTGTSGSRIVLDGTTSGAPTLTLYDSNNNVLMQATNQGLTVNGGTITGGIVQTATSGARIVLDGVSVNAPQLTAYDSIGNILMQADSNGLTVNGGTLTGGTVQTATSGARIVLDGASYNAPQLTAYDSLGNVLMQADSNGLTVNEGTITGATIQNASTGARILMDSSSSIKGYYGEDLHNIINMEQNNSGTHHMIVDATDRIDIRTPKEYVTDQSAGTSSTTVYETFTDNTDGYTFVSRVEKDMEGRTELFLKGVEEAEADVYCTLPVILTVTKTNFHVIHGRLLTGYTETSESID